MIRHPTGVSKHVHLLERDIWCFILCTLLNLVISLSGKSLNLLPHFNAKMPQIQFRQGLRPIPAGEAYSAPRPLSWI